MKNPKLFISYSWSSSTHEQMVIDLACELRESGVDVILDKWDLKEGQDAISFMEKMVSDDQIQKVIMITDRVYVEKADERQGGVGTETQIISKNVYEAQDQTKFVAVVTEKDENGKPYVPIYYQSRIHIDLSEPDTYSENFEKLLRWIFDKPLHVKPKIGSAPDYIKSNAPIQLGTSALHKRAINSIKDNKPNAKGTVEEYFNIFVDNFKEFRIETTGENKNEFDEIVVASIESFLPYRNQYVQLLTAICMYTDDINFIDTLHRFLEKLIPYTDREPGLSGSFHTWDYDNYRFILHELFLYTIALFLKFERFEYADYLLRKEYYVQRKAEYGKSVMVSYTDFRRYLQSLDHRNKRLKANRASINADLIEQRTASSGLEFRYLMQADFVLFMRTEVVGENSWWTETLVYLERFSGAFEIFARASSKEYFEKIKKLIAIDKPSDLDKIMEEYKTRKRKTPSWGFHSVDPVSLMNFENLASKP